VCRDNSAGEIGRWPAISHVEGSLNLSGGSLCQGW
jgi:hypothetical protein